MEEFAITLRWNNKPKIVPSDYLKIRTSWYEHYGIIIRDYFFEDKDKEGKAVPLHMHGIVDIPKNFYRKNLMQYGLHLKLVPMFALQGWKEYCQKNVKKVLKTSQANALHGNTNIGLENKNLYYGPKTIFTIKLEY